MTALAQPHPDAATRQIARQIPMVVAANLVVMMLLWQPAALMLPLARDQGIFAWVGTVMLSGGMPYQDAWEVKGPLVHAAYALAIALFGANELAIRLFDSLIWLAGCVAIWRLASIYGGGLLAIIALPVMALVLQGKHWMVAQPDVWAGLAAVGMLALVMRPEAGSRAYAAAGALVGCMFLVKPNYALFAAAIATAGICLNGHTKRTAGLLIAAAAGTLGVVAAVAALFAALGTLQALIDTVFMFNLRDHVGRHNKTAGEFATLIGLDFLDWHRLPRTLLASAGIVAMHARFGIARTAPLVVTILVAYAIGASQLKWYPAHFVPFDMLMAFPCVFALLAAAAQVEHCRPGKDMRAAIAGFATVCACTLFMLFVPIVLLLALTSFEWNRVLGKVAVEDVDRHYSTEGYSRVDIGEAARFVRHATKPGDGIYLWGFDALVYVLAERPSVSRFGFNYPMIVGSPAFAQASRRTLLVELAKRPPAAILVQDGDANNLYPKSSRAYLDEFPRLRELIASDYREAYHNNNFTVFLRR